MTHTDQRQSDVGGGDEGATTPEGVPVDGGDAAVRWFLRLVHPVPLAPGSE